MNRLTSAGAVAAEVARRIAGISIANGYETDIGLQVKRGKRKVDEDQVGAGCVTIIEGDDSTESRPGRQPICKIAQKYVIGGYVPCDAEHPNDAAHAMIRDMKRAIFGGEVENLNNSVDSVTYLGRDIGPRADGVAIVFAMIEISVTFVEDLRNP